MAEFADTIQKWKGMTNMNNKKNNETNINQAENKNTKDGISEQRATQIRQKSLYNEEDLPAPDNNLFWEHASNPLSSKGN